MRAGSLDRQGLLALQTHPQGGAGRLGGERGACVPAYLRTGVRRRLDLLGQLSNSRSSNLGEGCGEDKRGEGDHSEWGGEGGAGETIASRSDSPETGDWTG